MSYRVVVKQDWIGYVEFPNLRYFDTWREARAEIGRTFRTVRRRRLPRDDRRPDVVASWRTRDLRGRYTVKLLDDGQDS